MSQAHARATAKAAAPTAGPAHPAAGPSLRRAALEEAFADPARSAAPSARVPVEAATGRSLADVRVHTGPRVRTAAHAAGAAAFTIGRHIGVAVGPGQAIPDRLLRHELIHAAQQASRGRASPDDAEAQAQRGASGPGTLEHLASAGAPYAAFAAEDWLQGTPDVRQYGFSELVDELRAVNEWLDRQTTGSEQTDRMAEAKTALEAEIARRKGAIRAADRPRSQRRGRAKEPAAQPGLPEQTEMPRVLKDRTSFQLTDPAEIRTEVDRITAWLQRPDLSPADRSTLRGELASLEPGLGADLNRASAQRQQARLAQAFSPAAGADRAAVLENIRVIESIRPYQARPGMAYVMHHGELLVFPQELGNQVRAEATDALQKAAERAQRINESARYRMDQHMRLNYEDQPIVGFVVSLVSREQPVEVHDRMLGPSTDADVALIRYRAAQRRGSLTGMADAVFTAVEKADEAQTIVLNGVDKAVAAAGTIVTGLTITRDLSFAVALSIGAILAAPVVAAGVAGLGATGLTATGLTALGTGTVVGGEGLALGFTSGAGGELAAGHGGRAALQTGWSEAKRVGAQGAAIGVGGGASLGLARNLGVGAQELTRGAQLLRSTVAGGGGQALGSMTGAALSDVPKGQSRAGYVLGSGLTGFALGGFGAAAGTASQGLGSLARFGVGVGLPSAVGAGATYLQTGDLSQSLQTGALSVTVGALGSRQQSAGPTPAEQRAFSAGQRFMSRTRAFTGAAMLGLSNVAPALRMAGSSSSISTTTGQQEQVPVPQQPTPGQQKAVAPTTQEPQGSQVPGGGPSTPGPSAQAAQQAVPAGEEIWAQITNELALEAPKAHAGGVASAVADAQAGGLLGPRGAPGLVDVAVEPHSAASDVRAEYGVSGADVQSAHIGPTSFLRSQPGYSRSAAETTLLDRDVHAALDGHWKAWAIRQRQAGRTEVSTAELYNVMLEAIDRTPGLTARVKGALSFRLQQELFKDLGLGSADKLPLPYPNVAPK
jgi:uncharacterized protein DUF4157